LSPGHGRAALETRHPVFLKEARRKAGLFALGVAQQAFFLYGDLIRI